MNNEFENGELDDLVCDVKNREASAINNGGIASQLDFLREELGDDGLQSALRQVRDENDLGEVVTSQKTKRESGTLNGEEYFDGEFWLSEFEVCKHCMDNPEKLNYAEAFQRNSFGVYAGKYCDECWPKSGYRDATDPNATFSEADAGERLDELC